MRSVFVSSGGNRDLQKNEISWTIEDMNGPFSALDKLKRLWVRRRSCFHPENVVQSIRQVKLIVTVSSPPPPDICRGTRSDPSPRSPSPAWTPCSTCESTSSFGLFSTSCKLSVRVILARNTEAGCSRCTPPPPKCFSLVPLLWYRIKFLRKEAASLYVCQTISITRAS